MDTEPEVLVEDADGVRTITINRPQARNAVNSTVAALIAAAIDEFEAREDLAVVILTGAGGFFCAGLDLKAFRQGGSGSIPGRGFGGLTESPPTKPLVVAVEGFALAGGFELALTADIVVAARSARFGLPEVQRGLVAAAGGLLRLPKVLPRAVSMRLALTGDPMSADEALRHGLVSVLAEDGAALAQARVIAARIASNGPLAVRVTKQVISETVAWTEPAAFTRQRELAAEVFASADAQEGARAFAEKRAPVWTGR